MKAKNLLAFSFFFIFLNIAFGYNFIAGSSYYFDYPKCEALNISIYCNEKIDANEFIFNDVCKLENNMTYYNKYVCKCYDGFVLNLTINKASKNNCLFVFTNTYKIATEKITETKSYTYVSYVNPNITNITRVYRYEFDINQIKKLLENQSLAIENLNKKITKEIEIEKLKNLEFKVYLALSFVALLITFLLVYSLVFWYIIKKRNG